ncbi:MAG: inositol monophosphatase family protein, partial [Limisphaerales bacterium]
MKLELLHSLALTAAKRAGAYVQSMVNRCEDVRVKEAGDTPASQVVTEVDLESQRLILETLHESIEEFQLGLLTEESADDSSRFEKDCFWCIDPLDGTLPFINGSPGYSISIALVTREGKSQIGVIHDPGTEQTFHAVSGRGAFLNDVGIHSQYDTKSERLTWLMDSSMKGSAGYSRLLAAIEDLATRENLNLNIIAHAGAALNGSWVTQHAP